MIIRDGEQRGRKAEWEGESTGKMCILTRDIVCWSCGRCKQLLKCASLVNLSASAGPVSSVVALAASPIRDDVLCFFGCNFQVKPCFQALFYYYEHTALLTFRCAVAFVKLNKPVVKVPN